ncbi:MAG: glycosyl hydrolase-related protein [Nitrososphaerales archaeon]
MTPGKDEGARLPIYYTFGNHMHWVNMEWLWGPETLPGSVRDMLRFAAETGARGNINFDAAGYEKLASEAPDALAELRAAVEAGAIEVVGGSYGQPYGLFQGGESNIRQRVYGVRTVRRLLGVRPQAFWEEEFDFFPQLPQMLVGAGFRSASLFFQWTWHTPYIPEEDVSAVLWEGIDGTRLPAASRNNLNLHQWPEDVLELVKSASLCGGPVRGLVQWLELLPSPDWMCRSELMIPPLRTLMDSTECEIRFATLSEYVAAAGDRAPVRNYTLDDVYHGVSLGKNGDLFRHLSRRGEQRLLAAETLAAVAGLWGRPYASWDVYPAWELDEAWRQLLIAQHHDNDECEGLCGHIGQGYYAHSSALAQDVAGRTLQLLADRTTGPAGRKVAFNPLGWPRDVAWTDATGAMRVAGQVPAFGYTVLDPDSCPVVEPAMIDEDQDRVTLRRGALAVTVDRARGVITQIGAPVFPDGVLRPECPLAGIAMRRAGEDEGFPQAEVTAAGTEAAPAIEIRRHGREGAELLVTVTLAETLDAVDVHYCAEGLPRPDGGVAAALRTTIGINLPAARLIHDHPYGVSEIQARGKYVRKYPTGDWMTSPQVYEEVHGPFTALQLLDLCDGDRGLLYLHDGNQAFLRDGEAVQHILTMYDPWDEDYFVDRVDVHVRLSPHGPLNHAERWCLAQEFTRPAFLASAPEAGGDLPEKGGWFVCDAPGVAMTALYREAESAGQGFEGYAGEGIGFPYVVRLVELNGEPATARLTVPGPVAAAYRTNLLGEVQETLDSQEPWSCELPLAPYEIATVYLDLVPGRKVARGLDERRSVWATAHKVSQG